MEPTNRERPRINPRDNIVLIGMPGAGKSTVGVLLAKTLSLGFVDTDLVIQAREGRCLQAIIETAGIAGFCSIEERHVLSIETVRTVIATGGSVVYSDRAMRHLSSHGVVVHLEAPLAVLDARLTNLAFRGVVMPPGEALPDLYAERRPFYERYAQITVPCGRATHEQAVAALCHALGERGWTA